MTTAATTTTATARSPRLPAFCVAGTHSGAGKTTITLGLLAALRRRGLRVQPFKCGPDFIDPGHHREACGVASRNLDAWMMGEPAVRDSFSRAAAGADAAVVEGVMGLFDGAAADTLTGSTAQVCLLLGLPVILVIDARSMARSAAALVHGFATFEPGLRIAGVIANNVGSKDHRDLLATALAAAKLPPLLGALPRRPEWGTTERHLGLVAHTEAAHDAAWFDALAAGLEKAVDLAALPTIPRPPAPPPLPHPPPAAGRRPPRLGIARDAAFHFYYEDNLDALRAAGVELVEFSPLADSALPADLAGLYLGGGFPEMFASTLAGNEGLRAGIRQFAASGRPVYAECGGLMYLCETLTDRDGATWPMCGVLPAQTRMQSQLRRLGYVEVESCASGIFGPAGTRLRGHEFHWSELAPAAEAWAPVFVGRFVRGRRAERLGIRRGNVWASYVHVHFASNPAAVQAWAAALWPAAAL
ncbi:MAG: cobyrinate a,c-diamide synthase [Lentisphaeria bacterium]|jgi:cobyrinic acid a,c-diamide synthase